ncbi:hypothetical protein HZS_1027 [Henneguya salminicola]|nr:hypothetical protein HZS_1027 [Henneguya salminicola]
MYGEEEKNIKIILILYNNHIEAIHYSLSSNYSNHKKKKIQSNAIINKGLKNTKSLRERFLLHLQTSLIFSQGCQDDI